MEPPLPSGVNRRNKFCSGDSLTAIKGMKEKGAAKPEAVDEAPNDGLFAKIARKVLNNLQFSFNGLRVEMEDRFGHTYCVGFETLEILSTDSSFKPGVFVEEQRPVVSPVNGRLQAPPLYKIIKTVGLYVAESGRLRPGAAAS